MFKQPLFSIKGVYSRATKGYRIRIFRILEVQTPLGFNNQLQLTK